MSEVHRNLFDRPLPVGYREEMQALVAVEPPKPAARTGSVAAVSTGTVAAGVADKDCDGGVSRAAHLRAFRIAAARCCWGWWRFAARSFRAARWRGCWTWRGNETGAARMLILEEAPGRLWAVPIDWVLGIRATPESYSQEEAAPLAPHWMSGSFDDQGKMFHLLDHANMFPPDHPGHGIGDEQRTGRLVALRSLPHGSGGPGARASGRADEAGGRVGERGRSGSADARVAFAEGRGKNRGTRRHCAVDPCDGRSLCCRTGWEGSGLGGCRPHACGDGLAGAGAVA